MNNKEQKIHNTNREDAKKASSSVMRKCCACGKIADRKDFVRILHDYKTGEYIINPTNFQFGRSIYLCKNSDCLKIAQKKTRLKSLSDEQVDLLKKSIL